jgi:hypothetical protein
MILVATCVVGGMIVGNWTIPGTHRTTTSGWVNADALNVRDAPSISATILDVLPLGTRVSLLGEAENGFLPVSHAGNRAWVAEAYVSRVQQVSDTTGSRLPVVRAAEPDDGGGDSVLVRPTAPPVSAQVQELATGEHWIDVNRTTATVTLYIGTTAQAQYAARIGWDDSPDGFYATAIGTYHVFTMNPGLSSTPFVDDVYMTEFVGFDPVRHNGFHSPIRNADGSIRELQNPTTLGCVRLDEAGAAAVYAFASIGMRVEIHD